MFIASTPPAGLCTVLHDHLGADQATCGNVWGTLVHPSGLATFWFTVVAILWAGFFLLEGFDFGVGILLRYVGKNDDERTQTVRTIGHVWDGNQVWLLTAGGATFAAFPHWYATMFSGFYLAFALLLVGLILRGIGIEYRGKTHTERGRTWAEWAIIIGSFLPALLLGVAFANIGWGVNITGLHSVPALGGPTSGDMTNSLFSLLNPFGLLGGLVTLTLFIFHGAVFLTMRTDGEVAKRARKVATGISPIVAVLAVAFVIWVFYLVHHTYKPVLQQSSMHMMMMYAAAIILILAFVVSAAVMFLGKSLRLAFAASGVTAALIPIWLFIVLFPTVMPARNDILFTWFISQASSSHTTLVVMTWVACIFTPIVLIYIIWTYWAFRARVTGKSVLEGDGGYATPLRKLVTSATHSAREVFPPKSQETGKA